MIELINQKLDEYLAVGEPAELFEAMRYTVLLPGKRLRPVMCLETCRVFGGNIEDALPTACAIEMLHAQSLIHDDLPCMDNDDFRRGKPANHKVFSEAVAVLAGDALLTFAPQLIIEKSNLPAETKLRVVEEYCKAAGAYGLVAGQVVDMNPTADALEFIQIHKTAVLFRLAMRAGAIIAGVDDLTQVTDFAQKLGVAFQIADDILDETATFEQTGKTTGKDKAAQKLTAVSVYGLDEAKCKLACLLDECRGKMNSGLFEQIIDKMEIQ
jgi:geranylgeranyl diphosphate synthase type II